MVEGPLGVAADTIGNLLYGAYQAGEAVHDWVRPARRSSYDYYGYRRRQETSTGKKVALGLGGAAATAAAIYFGGPAAAGAGKEAVSAIQHLISLSAGTTENHSGMSGQKDKIPQATPTPVKEKTPVPQPTVRAFIQQESQNFYQTTAMIGDLTFHIDSDGITVEYVTHDGQVVKLDKNKLQQTQRLARTSHEGQVFNTITLPASQDDKKIVPNPDHPVLEKLPSDVLTAEQLKKRGITIVQDKPTFFIKQTAFADGMPLADYKPGSNTKLEYYILDAPFVSDIFMNDPKFERARNAFLGKGGLFQKDPAKIDVKEIKMKTRTELEQQLKQLRVDFVNPNLSNDEKWSKDLQLTQVKAQLSQIDELSDQDWFWLGCREWYDRNIEASGIYFRGGSPENRVNIIVMAMGQPVQSPERITIAFDSLGNVQFPASLGNYYFGGNELKADQSEPDPAWYVVDPAIKEPNYVVVRRGIKAYPAFTNAHELGHDFWMDHRFRTIHSTDPTYLKPDGTYDFDRWFKDIMPNPSEYDADMKAVAYFKSAWEIKQKTGQDTGYGFVFRLPEGGYILAEKESPMQKLAEDATRIHKDLNNPQNYELGEIIDRTTVEEMMTAMVGNKTYTIKIVRPLGNT